MDYRTQVVDAKIPRAGVQVEGEDVRVDSRCVRSLGEAWGGGC